MSSELRRRKQGGGGDQDADADADAGASPAASSPSPSPSPSPPPPSQGVAVVVGGGPAGALSAKVLSDRGYSVSLYEAYPRPTGSSETSQSYVISLGPRGRRALRRCGVDPSSSDLDGAVMSPAVVRHAPPGKKATVRKVEEASAVCRRGALTASLLRIAEGAGVSVHCGHRLAGVDFEGRTATFVKAGDGGGGVEEERVTAKYDLLVGADGARSPTRSLLAEKCGGGDDEGFRVLRTEEDTMEYQVAVLPRWRDLLADAEGSGLDAAPSESTHAWADPPSNSNALGFPLEDGRTLVCVICPGGRLGRMKEESAAAAEKGGGGTAGYDAPLAALFDDWTPSARSDLASQLVDPGNVPRTGGTCVWTSSLSHPPSGVVLVGDSGHAMWPSLGQGGNCAVESASVLADAVEAVLGRGTLVPSAGAGVRALDTAKIPAEERASRIAEEYDGLRREDALAAVSLTHGGIGGRRVRGSQNVTALFKLRVAFQLLLHKVTMGAVPPPAVFRIMRGDDARYSTLQWQARCESAAARGAALAVTTLLLAGAVVAWAAPS